MDKNVENYLENKAQSLLQTHQLRRTNFRVELLKVFLKRSTAIAQTDIEAGFQSGFDRVTLYRTLKSFEESGLIHRIIDEKSSPKFALCESTCSEHQHHDDHLHFNCTICHNTYCLHAFKMPALTLPEGFTIADWRLSAEGVCNLCNT